MILPVVSSKTATWLATIVPVGSTFVLSSIVISLLPSNAIPFIFTGVFNLVAVPAFPLTSVCNGWTWSPLETLVDVPALAVPLACGTFDS